MPTHHIADFLETADIYISPEIQQQPHYPFTMACAKRFFDEFRRSSFEFDRSVRAIFIFRGKEALPRNSFAEGWLFSKTVNELENYAARNNGNLPENIGIIYMDCGAPLHRPYIKITGKGGFRWVSGPRQ